MEALRRSLGLGCCFVLAACASNGTGGMPPVGGANALMPAASRSKGFSVVYAFSGNAPYGRYLTGGVMLDTHGNIFGTTEYSPYSDAGYGTLFELQPSGSTYTESTIASFDGSDGAYPIDKPIEDAAGNLYLTTNGSGSSGGYGTVNEFTNGGSGWTQSALEQLGAGSTGGKYPTASPYDSSGTLYVPTTQGGSVGLGAIYALAAKTLSGSVFYSFAGPDKGDLEYPYSVLVRGPNHVLYGTAEGGGAGFGTQGGGGGIYTVSGTTYTKIFQFPASNSQVFPDGAASESPLVFDKAGSMYGTAILGGSYKNCQHGCGVVFKVRKKGGKYNIEVLHRFTAGKDGYEPHAGLTLVGNTLYGTTVYGGTDNQACGDYGCGTLFAVNTNGKGYKVLHRFDGADGEAPGYGSLALSGSTLYGTTLLGTPSAGANGGVVYAWKL